MLVCWKGWKVGIDVCGTPGASRPPRSLKPPKAPAGLPVGVEAVGFDAGFPKESTKPDTASAVGEGPVVGLPIAVAILEAIELPVRAMDPRLAASPIGFKLMAKFARVENGLSRA
jgi:hypothetical protein